MNYNILNEILINWDNANASDSENTFLKSDDINSKLISQPDFSVLQKFSIDPKESSSVDGKILHRTYTGILPNDNWSSVSKFKAGRWGRWIDYITFPDFEPVSHIKFILNKTPRDPELDYTRYNFGWTFKQIIESAERNNGYIDLAQVALNIPTQSPFSYEEMLECCPDRLFNVNFYIQDDIEVFPSEMFYRMPWTQGIKFYNTGKFKIFSTSAFGYINLKIPLKFPEGTKKLKKGILDGATVPEIYIPKSVTSIESGALRLAQVPCKEHVCHITIPEKFKKRILDIFYPYYKGWFPPKDFTGTIDDIIELLEEKKNIKFTFI